MYGRGPDALPGFRRLHWVDETAQCSCGIGELQEAVRRDNSARQHPHPSHFPAYRANLVKSSRTARLQRPSHRTRVMRRCSPRPHSRNPPTAQTSTTLCKTGCIIRMCILVNTFTYTDTDTRRKKPISAGPPTKPRSPLTRSPPSAFSTWPDTATIAVGPQLRGSGPLPVQAAEVPYRKRKPYRPARNDGNSVQANAARNVCLMVCGVAASKSRGKDCSDPC